MSDNSRIVVGLFFSVIIHVSYAMEQSVPEKPSNQSEEMVPYGSFASSVMPIFGDVSSYFSRSLESLTNTVTNQVSDEAAFRKLGWPLSDSVAQAELVRTRDRYKLILTDTSPQIRQEYLSTILNRTSYLTRAYIALSKRTDGVPFAEHCIKEHSCAMYESLKILFSCYLAIKEEESVRASNSAKKILIKDGNVHQSATASHGATIDDGSLPIDVKNGLPELDIFLRIGWAFGDRAENAKKYLQKCLDVYKIKQAMKTTKSYALLQTSQGRASLGITENSTTEAMIKDPVRCRRFVEKREEFIKRAYLSLPSRADGLELAAYCLNYHTYVMTKYLEEDFLIFIQQKQQLTRDICKQIHEKRSQHNDVA